MFLNLDELENGDINNQNEVWIKAGKCFAVPVEISKPNTVFGWEFTSYPKVHMGLVVTKPCLLQFTNNKGADQSAHPRSLISAFVYRLLECNISRLATRKF